MRIHESINADRVIELVQEDDGAGLCIYCGNDQYGCEPDARRYPCESCGFDGVYGAEELLIHVVC